MSYSTEEKIKALRLIAREDKEYSALVEEYNMLEKNFTEVTQKLTRAEQDVVWAFLCTSDAVDHRLLEIIFEGIQTAER